MKKYIETEAQFIVNNEKQLLKFEEWLDNTIDIEIISMSNKVIMINKQRNLVISVKYRKYDD